MKQRNKITESQLHYVIKEAIDDVLNVNSDLLNDTIETMERYDWVIDNINENIIMGHLEECEDFTIVVEVRRIGAYVTKVHYEGDELDVVYCMSLQDLIQKLAEIY